MATATTTARSTTGISPAQMEAGQTQTVPRGGSYSLCGRVARYVTDGVLGVNCVGSFGGAVWSYVDGTYPQAGLFSFSVIVSIGGIYLADRYFAMKALKQEADQLVLEERKMEGNEDRLATLNQQFQDVSGKLTASESALAQRTGELDATKSQLQTTAGQLAEANKELSALKAAQAQSLIELRNEIASMQASGKELQRQLDEKDRLLKKESATTVEIRADNDRLQGLLKKMDGQVAGMQTAFAAFKETVGGFSSLNESFLSALPELGSIAKDYASTGKDITKDAVSVGSEVEGFDQKFKADIKLLESQIAEAKSITAAIFAKLNEEIQQLKSSAAQFKAGSTELADLERQRAEKEAALERLQTDTAAQVAKLESVKVNLAAAEEKLAKLAASIQEQEAKLAAGVKEASREGESFAETQARLHQDMSRAGDLLEQFKALQQQEDPESK